MKIAFFVSTVLEYGGGLEKYYIETASKLAEDPLNQVDIISLDDNFSIRLTTGLSAFYFKKIDPKLYFKESSQNIKDKLKDAHYHKVSLGKLRPTLQEYDVIYSKNELLEATILKLYVGYKHLPPVVFGGHTALQYPNATSLHAKLHNYLYGGGLYKFLASGVSRFHVLNGAEEAAYRRLFPSKPVYKIYNPFDSKAFRQQAHEYPYTLKNLDHHNINILWLGRLTEQKGVKDLSQIIEYINKYSSSFVRPVSWTIVGDGELRYVVDDLATKYTNVATIGHIDQKYTASIYSAHDIFISTSKWEGYPYTLLEAISCKLDIVSYAIPGPLDILSVYKKGHIAKNRQDIEKELLKVVKYLQDNSSEKVDDPTQFKPEKIYADLLAMLKYEEIKK